MNKLIHYTKTKILQKQVYMLLLFCLSVGTMNGQSTLNHYPETTPVNPEAAGIIKALTYPVGYNTGVPEISIPLYEVKSRSLTIPLTLNYHAGGFKVNEVAAPTGLGWTLSANYQIVREINGFDDFRKGSFDYSGYYYNQYGMTDVPWNTGLYDDLQSFEIANGMIDTQPDRFYYNIPGKSGSFYLSKGNSSSRVFLPDPYNGIAIACILSTGESPSVVFKITDTDGTEYKFEIAEVVTDPSHETSAYESAWKCTSIVSPDRKETITLGYEPLKNRYSYLDNDYFELYEDLQGLQGQPWSTYGGTFFANQVKERGCHSYTDVLQKFAFFTLSVPRGVSHSYARDAGFYMYTQNSYGGYDTDLFDKDFTSFSHRSSLRTHLVLSQIKMPGAKVNFDYDTQECLKLIRVTDSSNRTLRTFHFDQTVVGSEQSISHTDRTNYLNAVRMEDAQAETTSYAFEYTSMYAFGNYAHGGDYWGGVNFWTTDRSSFYNSSSTVPGVEVTTKHYYANHYSSFITDFKILIGGRSSGDLMIDNYPDGLRRGQLKKITYPTGGYTEFDFGMNYGSFESTPNTFEMGGLRINEIRNFNADGALQNKKVYRYGEYGAGIPCGIYYNTRETIGQPFSYKQEVEYFVNPEFSYQQVLADARDILETKTTYLANILEDMNFASGAPVYYDKVTEYDVTMILNQVSHTDVPFRKRIVMGVYINPYTGEHHHSEITDPQKLRELGKEKYITMYSQNVHTGAVCPIKKTEISYDGGQAHRIVTQYQYDARFQPTATTVTYPDGHSERERVSYSGNFPSSDPLIRAMKSRNLTGVPIKIEQSILRYDSEYFTGGVFRLFKADNPALIEKLYKATPGGTTPSFTEGGITVPKGYQQKATFGYDGKYNLTSIVATDAPTTVYLWGYNCQYPIAEITNSDYQTVRAALGNTLIDALQSSYNAQYIRDCIQTLREHPLMQSAQVKTFTYVPQVGLSEAIDAGGANTSYIHDGSGRLTEVVDHERHTVTGYEYHYVR